MFRALLPQGNRTPSVPTVTTMATVFLIAGIVGCISLIGSLVGLGWLELSVPQTLAYLVLGIVGRRQARTSPDARPYLLGAGLTCLMLWFSGMLIGRHGALDVLVLGPVDNLLHLGLGITLFVLGAFAGAGSGHRLVVGGQLPSWSEPPERTIAPTYPSSSSATVNTYASR